MAKMFSDSTSVLNQMVKVPGSAIAFALDNDDHAAADGHMIFKKTVTLQNFDVVIIGLNRSQVIQAAAKIEGDEPTVMKRIPRFTMREVHDGSMDTGGRQLVVYTQSGI